VTFRLLAFAIVLPLVIRVSQGAVKREELTKSSIDNGIEIVVICPVLLSGKENYIVLVVRNKSTDVLDFESDGFLNNISLNVRSQDGPAGSTALYRSRTSHTRSFQFSKESLKSGGEFKVKVNLTRCFDLSVQGELRDCASMEGRYLQHKNDSSGEGSHPERPRTRSGRAPSLSPPAPSSSRGTMRSC
jgi:hypothetical protein